MPKYTELMQLSSSFTPVTYPLDLQSTAAGTFNWFQRGGWQEWCWTCRRPWRECIDALNSCIADSSSLVWKKQPATEMRVNLSTSYQVGESVHRHLECNWASIVFFIMLKNIFHILIPSLPPIIFIHFTPIKLSCKIRIVLVVYTRVFGGAVLLKRSQDMQSFLCCATLVLVDQQFLGKHKSPFGVSQDHFMGFSSVLACRDRVTQVLMKGKATHRKVKRAS